MSLDEINKSVVVEEQLVSSLRLKIKVPAYLIYSYPRTELPSIITDTADRKHLP